MRLKKVFWLIRNYFIQVLNIFFLLKKIKIKYFYQFFATHFYLQRGHV
jgi:hypothetical protein